ncbi:hypothetical protein ABIF63_001849 [Bradyrhizobium japonicum]|uniref:Uncharacterized protein n=1 Tax=Bradyrhizobium japonicum TaxID=375 RepID=A0ABV2RLC7_BRAJP
MNRLYPLVLEHRLPILVRYSIPACIMLVCALLEVALQMQTGPRVTFCCFPAFSFPVWYSTAAPGSSPL